MKAFRVVLVALVMAFSLSFLSGDASGQNQVTLRDYLDVLINERTKQLEIRMESSEKAVRIASENLQRELEKLNNLRQEVTRDRSMLVSQDAYNVEVKAIRASIQELKERLISLETRFVTWISAISIFFVVVQLLINYFNRRALKTEIK